jgi:hypothetical protein
MAASEGLGSEAERKRRGAASGAEGAERKRAVPGKQTRSGAQGAGGAGPAAASAEQGGGSGSPQGAGDWAMTPELASAMGLSFGDDEGVEGQVGGSAGAGKARGESAHATGATAPVSDREPEGKAAASGGQQLTAIDSGGGGGNGPVPGNSSPDTVRDAPTEVYIVPFDRSPLAAPGERIICRAEFTGATDADYEIVYSCVNGHFNSAAGPASVTVQGLRSGNVNFYVPSPWNGTDAVSVTMKLRKRSNASIAQTETWTYAKKAIYPTKMTQKEGTGERTLPGVYNYDLGPELPAGTKPFYEHQTILEWFDTWTIPNIEPADIKEAYRTANNLTSKAAITTFVLGPYAGSNGTFTVNNNDVVADQHGGHPDVEDLASNLVTPKDIEVALPQTYEAKPGTSLGKYMVTRVRKTDGSWKVKKAPR